MSTIEPTVFLVDDELAVLKALGRVLHAAGFRTSMSSSPQEFLTNHDAGAPGCVVIDFAMPGLDGPQLQRALAERGDHRPIIFLTGRADIPTSVRAMKAGAVDFLTKPVNDAELIDTIGRAVEEDRLARGQRAELSGFHERLATLTPREREVMAQVVSGKLNKQVAAELGTAEKTVKVHRARVMEKLRVGSLAELVRLCERTGASAFGGD